jgi:hypothetical protein
MICAHTFLFKVPFSFCRVTNPSCCLTCPFATLFYLCCFRGGTWLAGPSTISMTLPISPQLVRCCEDVLPLRWANLLNDRLYALKFLHMC